MDTSLAAALAALLASAPNLVIAIWTITRQDARIDKFQESQKWLIEKLMALHPPQDGSLIEHQRPQADASGEHVEVVP